jgi:hypothetical protein
MRPRVEPLRGFTDEELERRQRIEVGIAEMRMGVVQSGGRVPPEGRDIEELAARIEAQGVPPGVAGVP